MATNLERIQAMMEEIGPAMAEIEAVIQSEDKNWAIQFALPLGILTDRDILVETIALDVEAHLFTASDLMSSPVTTVLEDAGLTEALGVMRGKRIRRLPVVNRAGGLVGMVTTDDLLDLLAAELSMLAGLVVEQPIKEERTRK
jgi:CBS domain-containing protein